MYIGIDLGTSGVKAILLDEAGEVVASHSAAQQKDRDLSASAQDASHQSPCLF